jgi:peroxiredoxin
VTTIESGALAPHFTLLGLDGREYSLPGDTQGRPALLVFFRVSCETCDIAFPYVNRLAEAYPDGWDLWAISQDDPDRSAAYRDRFGLTYPVLLDAPALDASLLYDPPSTPGFFLVGPDGRVDFALEGFDKVDLNEISRRIAFMLGAQAVEIAPENDGNPSMRPGCMARQRFPVRRPR